MVIVTKASIKNLHIRVLLEGRRLYRCRRTHVYVQSIQIMSIDEQIIHQNNKVEKICIMYYNLK